MRAVLQVFGFELVSKVLVGVVGIALIRLMQPAEYARLTFALACATFASQALTFAFNRIYVVSEVEASQARIDGMVSAQVLAVASLGLVLLPAVVPLGTLYIPVVLLVLGSAIADFTKTMYQRDQRFLRFSMVELGRSLLYLSGIVAVYLLFGGTLHARWVLAAQIGAMLTAALVAWRLERRPAPRLSLASGGTVLREMVTGASRFLLLYFVLLSLFGQLEVLLLERLAPPLALASYGAAVRYYGLLSLALGAVHTVLLPLVHEARLSGRLDEVLREQRRLLLAVIPILVVAAVVAGWALPWVDGGKYPESVLVFRILTLSALFSFVLSPYSNVLISAGRYRTLCARVLVATLVGGAVSVVAIPRVGAVGAALGQTAGFLVFNVLIFTAAQAVPRVAAPVRS